MTRPPSTRDRLLDEGMRLFAAHGFATTSVRDIERAVGLQPGRGGLYKHFPSKQDLLDAGMREHLDRATKAASQLEAIDVSYAHDVDPTDLRPFIRALGEWFLSELDRLETLTHLIEHDGPRMPAVTAELKANLVDLSHRAAVRFIEAVGPSARDPEATAVLLLGGLVAMRRTAWTYGSAPLDVDDARAITAWVELVVAALGKHDSVGP